MEDEQERAVEALKAPLASLDPEHPSVQAAASPSPWEGGVMGCLGDVTSPLSSCHPVPAPRCHMAAMSRSRCLCNSTSQLPNTPGLSGSSFGLSGSSFG